MKFENIAMEWKECRNTVSRFDNYLLRLRLLGFSVFTLIFTAITGAAGSNSEKSAFTSESILIAIATLSLFVLAIYILDRYYERMLLIAVLRASRLESHRMEGFRIGLTTEIEFQKEQLFSSSFGRKFKKASFMVNFVYALVFIAMWSQYIIVFFHGKPSFFYLVILLLLVGIITMVAMIGNSMLKEPNSLIASRSQVVQCPIVMSKEEINHTVKRIAKAIVKWIEQEKTNEIHVISIQPGARPFTEDLLKEIDEMKADVECYLHFLRLELHLRNGKSSKKCSLIFGELAEKLFQKKHVLIVDSIIDSGATLNEIIKMVESQGATSIKTAVIIKKKQTVQMNPDFIGFHLGLTEEKYRDLGLEDCWIFGYGMDYEGHYREMEHIGLIHKSQPQEK